MQYHHSALLQPLPAIHHGFFGRRGGVSSGLYASLNVALGSSDEREHVMANRQRVLEAMEAEHLVTLKQVHSARCLSIASPADVATVHYSEGDALVTNQRGVALGVLTADCVPVLLCDAKARVIGAAHAGWKGAFGGVLEATLDAMEALGAEKKQIVAAIGPAIQQPSYEVDGGFYERFLAENLENAGFFVPSPKHGHWLFDVAGYAAMRLEKAGVEAIDRMMLDTYSDEAGFFSFRRATHRQEVDYGRQVSAICLM